MESNPLLAEYYFVCRKPLNRNPQVGPRDLAVDELSIKYLTEFIIKVNNIPGYLFIIILKCIYSKR